MVSKIFRKTRVLVFLISLTVYLVVGFFINAVWRFRDAHIEGAYLSVQRSAYGVVQRRMEESGEIPKAFAAFPERVRQYIHYYNPDAWQDPQRVLFRYQRGRFHYVTFGDSRQAVLVCLTPAYQSESEPKEMLKLGGDIHLFAHGIRVVVFGIIGILIATLVSSKLLKNKK